MADYNKKKGTDLNPDPITGTPGSHPVGTGLGSAGGAAAGVVAGAAVGGPVGAVIGGAIGAIAGGAAGHAIGEAIDPTVEEAYWRDNYLARPYVDRSLAYDNYAPAYRYGWESRAGQPGSQVGRGRVRPRARLGQDQGRFEPGVESGQVGHARCLASRREGDSRRLRPRRSLTHLQDSDKRRLSTEGRRFFFVGKLPSGRYIDSRRLDSEPSAPAKR